MTESFADPQHALLACAGSEAVRRRRFELEAQGPASMAQAWGSAASTSRILMVLLLVAAAAGASAQTTNATSPEAANVSSSEAAGNSTGQELDAIPLSIQDYRTYVQDGWIDVANFTTTVGFEGRAFCSKCACACESGTYHGFQRGLGMSQELCSLMCCTAPCPTDLSSCTAPYHHPAPHISLGLPGLA